MYGHTALAGLLTEAFPTWVELASNCWVNQAIDQNQEDFGDLIDCLGRSRGTQDLIGRLRDQHPIKGLHHDQHDKRLLDVFTEGAAFAWAYDVAKLGQPSFVKAQGAPDIAVGEVWIEAKTVRSSQEEERFDDEVIRPALDRHGIVMRGPETLVNLHQGFISKFQSDFDDALSKWQRQDKTGSLIVFYNMKIDFGTSFRTARRQVIEWATRIERSTRARIVICESYNWQSPLFSSRVASNTRP